MSTFLHNFWVLDVLFSFRKPTRSTFSIRVSSNRFSTGVLLHILFVWQVDHTQPYQRLFWTCFLLLQTPSFRPTCMKKNQSLAREPGLLKRSPQQRAPESPWPVPWLLSPTTVPEETKEVDSFTSHSLYMFIILRRVFFFNRSQRAGSAWPVLFPAWGLSRKSETKKAGAVLVLVCGQAFTLLVVAAWSHNRGHPHHTPPPRPRSPVVRPRLRIVAVKGHDFLLKLCLLPSYVNAWSHDCRSWSQCERKILTGK